MKSLWVLFGTATFIVSWFTNNDVNLTVIGCYAYIMYKLEEIKDEL